MRTVLLGLVSGFVIQTGCRADPIIERPDDDEMPGALPPDTQMLLTPVGDPDGLLGRLVEQDAAGAWVIADARAPGCEVSIKRVPMGVTTEHVEEARRVASFAVGSERLARLTANYSKGLRKYAKIVNVEQLEADLRGSCGENVITSQVLIYRREDGRTKLNVRLDEQTVWLSQRQLGELFGKAKGTISEHIYEDGELDPGATVRQYRTVHLPQFVETL